MPTTYAHWRFGDRCIRTLPGELQELIRKNRRIFDYGVHGPDIFFYYNCLKGNDVNRFGDALHDRSFASLLTALRPGFLSCDDREAATAYLLGFACHFTLDSYCHGYIERKKEVSGVSHNKIESQLDRYLLELDGYDPVKKKTTFSLKPGHDLSRVISQLFSGSEAAALLDEKTVYRTICDQKLYLNLLKDTNDLKRWFLATAMDALHVTSFKDLMTTKVNLPETVDSNLRIAKLSEKALAHYPAIAASVLDYLRDGSAMDPYLENHFGPREDYQTIPVLSAQEEREYRIP